MKAQELMERLTLKGTGGASEGAMKVTLAKKRGVLSDGMGVGTWQLVDARMMTVPSAHFSTPGATLH